jgi:hypothetical protein
VKRLIVHVQAQAPLRLPIAGATLLYMILSDDSKRKQGKQCDCLLGDRDRTWECLSGRLGRARHGVRTVGARAHASKIGASAKALEAGAVGEVLRPAVAAVVRTPGIPRGVQPPDAFPADTPFVE